MENSFQTSFIPKKPMVSNFSNKTPKSLLYLIIVFFLVLSIVLSIGLFLYKNYLNKQISSLSSSLSLARASFEKETIDELALFDKKTSSAKQILNNHIVLSPFFALLGKITIPAIQYTSFSQRTNDNTFFVEINGIAKDYRSIALQSNAFSSSEGRLFQNVLFSNLTKDENNNVSFNLKFNVDPSLLSYKNLSLEKQSINSGANTQIPDISLQDLENRNQ